MRPVPVFYRLDANHAPVPCTMEEFALSMHGDRTIVAEQVGRMFVSTVFLGLDHRFHGEGPPILFETMVFEAGEEYQTRCATYADALAQHQRAVHWAAQRL